MAQGLISQSFSTVQVHWRWVILLFLTGFLIATVSFFFSPIGQRYLAAPAAAAPVAGTTTIQLMADDVQNHVFSPAVVEISAGTTLTWQFAEIDEEGQPVAHNVIFENFGSDVLSTGTYQATFDQPGEYIYRCTLHPFMDGKVIVTAIP